MHKAKQTLMFKDIFVGAFDCEHLMRFIHDSIGWRQIRLSMLFYDLKKLFLLMWNFKYSAPQMSLHILAFSEAPRNYHQNSLKNHRFQINILKCSLNQFDFPPIVMLLPYEPPWLLSFANFVFIKAVIIRSVWAHDYISSFHFYSICVAYFNQTMARFIEKLPKPRTPRAMVNSLLLLLHQRVAVLSIQRICN